jgi:hypothetical protein
MLAIISCVITTVDRSQCAFMMMMNMLELCAVVRWCVVGVMRGDDDDGVERDVA